MKAEAIAPLPAAPRKYRITPLREAQRDLTRSRIRDAARSLFLSQRYAATSIDQIANLAGLQRTTIYLHYADKAAILADIVEDYAPRAQQRMATLPGPRPDVDRIERWIEELESFFEAEQVALLIAHQVGTQDPHPPELDALTQRLLEGFAVNHRAFTRAASADERNRLARAHGVLVIGMLARVGEVSIGRSRPDWLKSLRRATAENIAAYLERFGHPEHSD